MEWRALLTSFGLIFLAEMGDKTQLATISLVAKTRSPWAVLIGSSLALIAVSALGVFGGAILVRFVPEAVIRKAAAVAFIAVGVLMLGGKA